MKSTGVVRKIDCFGRLVFPAEIRKCLDISENDPMEFFVEDGMVIVRKYNPSCIFCGSVEDTVDYEGKLVCKKCIDKLSKELN